MTILKLDSKNMFGTDGSGNQKKIWVDNTLIKLNSKFREASKEVSASILGEAFGLNVVEYTKKEYLFNSVKHIGCECKSYLNINEISITLIEIINFYNIDIPKNMNSVDYFNITVECISKYTNLDTKDVQKYLMQMLVFDFLICNDDRHLTNIEFIYNERLNLWRFTPLYDHGQSFFGKDGGLTNQQIEQEFRKLKMKPFSTNPYKNLIDIENAKLIANEFIKNVNKQYGALGNIPINDFHKKIVKIQLDRLLKK